jgi:hypothetical protein
LRLQRKTFHLTNDWRRAIAALALAVFTIANFVTQTHVHLLGVPEGGKIAAAVNGFRFEQPLAPGKSNPFDDPATCPLCQDIALAGHFTTPAALPVLPPAPVALPVAIFIAMPAFVATVSHSWRGRAPPEA